MVWAIRQLTGTGEPERLTSVPVTGNFFAVLGVQPAIGRSFTTEECQGKYSAPPAMLLSYSFWRRRFASDPNVVGRKLTLNNRPVTVVGVLPASFDFGSVFAPGTPIDIFVPWPLTDKTKPMGNTMKVIGRLKPGATVQGAQAELTMLGKQLESQHPERNPIAPKLVPLEQHVSGPVSPALFVLACAVGVVMLIVCANLSNLQLARLGTRQKEMAMRAALGAGRFAAAAADAYGERGALLLRCGVGAGSRGGRHTRTGASPCIQSSFARKRSDRWERARFSPCWRRSLPAYSLACCRRCGSRRSRFVKACKMRSRGSSGGKRHAWVRDGLVVSELAFACILLVGAGLLIRSFLRVLDVNLGFQPERAAALRIDPSFRISSFAQQNSFIDDVLHRARSVPGIVAAGITDVLPLRDDRALGCLRRRTGLREGPPARGIHSRCERRVFRGGRNSVAVGKSIHGEGSCIERTRRGGQ